MKGFMRTAEAAVGVTIALSLLIALTPDVQQEETGLILTTELASDQLSNMISSGSLTEIIQEDGAEGIEEELESGPQNIEVQVEKIRERYFVLEDEETSFSAESETGEIFAWSEDYSEVELNGENQLEGTLDADHTSVSLEDNNDIEVDHNEARVLVREIETEGEVPETEGETRILERTNRLNQTHNSITRVFVYNE